MSLNTKELAKQNGLTMEQTNLKPSKYYIGAPVKYRDCYYLVCYPPLAHPTKDGFFYSLGNDTRTQIKGLNKKIPDPSTYDYEEVLARETRPIA